MQAQTEISSPETLTNSRLAAKNYLNALNIPSEKKPNFLIITDGGSKNLGRRRLANSISDIIHKDYEGSVTKYFSFEDYEREDDINKIVQEVVSDTQDLVVVLLSGTQSWRFGVYDAVEKGNDLQPNVLRFAYSPGLTAADSAILEQMDSTTQNKIRDEVEKRKKWFAEKKSGELVIQTGQDKQFSLTLHFDNEKAPVIPSSGLLSDENRRGNVPSGEAHLVPYPYNLSQGKIETTSGFIITVENGLATHVDTTHAHNVREAEAAFVDLVNIRDAGDLGIPLAELGMGVLENLGIQTKTDSRSSDGQMSILTLEKLRLHLGFGSIAGKSVEKDEIRSMLKKGDTHTDVLLSIR